VDRTTHRLCWELEEPKGPKHNTNMGRKGNGDRTPPSGVWSAKSPAPPSPRKPKSNPSEVSAAAFAAEVFLRGAAEAEAKKAKGDVRTTTGGSTRAVGRLQVEMSLGRSWSSLTQAEMHRLPFLAKAGICLASSSPPAPNPGTPPS